MEDNLHSHISSLMKSRDEYRALHEKLILANQLFEERDERSRRRISDLTSEADMLRKQLEDNRNSLAALHSQRAAFEKDVASLSRVAASLELREQEMHSGLRDLREQNAALREENAMAKVGQAELGSMHEQRAEAASRIALLEISKAALLTQIGNLKIANRREALCAAAAQQALAEVQAAADRYKDLFEAERAELEHYKECLEETEGQLNDSQREISEFRDILLQEVGGMALGADDDVDVTVYVDEYPTLDQMARRYDQEPAAQDADGVGGRSHSHHHSKTPVKAALSAIKHASGERPSRVSPADFSAGAALAADFDYSK